MLKVKLFGDWAKTAKIAQTMDVRFQRAQEQAVLREAHLLRSHIVKNITSGGSYAGKPFAALAPGTLIVRRFRGFGGTKPLLYTGSLRGSVSVVKLRGGAVFVGIKRGAASKGGAPPNIAEIHEFGGQWTVRMTARMRRFLAAAYRAAGQRFGKGGGGGGKGAGVIQVRIPARPYVGPVVEKFAKPEDVKERFWKAVAAGMGYDLGKA